MIVVIPEQASPTPDAGPIASVAAAFVAGWLTPGTPSERQEWLRSLTATPTLLAAVANIPPEVLPPGPAGDPEVVYVDEWRAGVHVPLPTAGVTAVLELRPVAADWRVSKLDKG